MKLNDVRDSAIGIIKAAFPTQKVYDETVKAGFVQGSFVIRIFPVSNNQDGVHYRMKSYFISISYKGTETFTSMNSVYDTLEIAFEKAFKVVSTDTIGTAQTRYLIPRNLRREDPADDRFVFLFDLNINDVVQETEDHVLAEELDLVINKV